MACLVNVTRADRILCLIFHSLYVEWRNRTLQVFTAAACPHPEGTPS